MDSTDVGLYEDYEASLRRVLCEGGSGNWPSYRNGSSELVKQAMPRKGVLERCLRSYSVVGSQLKGASRKADLRLAICDLSFAILLRSPTG